MEPDTPERNLVHLDGLRGLAAMIVVLHHFACAFLPAAVFGGGVAAHFAAERVMYLSPLQLFVAGNFAVCIFFALSGYVLSHKFFVTKNVQFARSGASKRFFRLMPPILAAVLLSYALYKFGLTSHLQAAQISGSQQWLGRLWPGPSGFIEALRQGTYGALIGTSDTSLFDNVLWTMKVEFFGSFLVFAFLALAGTIRLRWLVYMSLGLLLWNTYYLAFLFGLALCDVNVNRPELKLRWPIVLSAMLTGLLLGAAPIITTTHTLYSQLTLPFLPKADMYALPHVVGSGLVLLAVVFSPLLKRGLAIRPLRYVGRISFSIYLLHVLIIGTLSCWLLRVLAPHMSYFHALAVALALTLPAIWLVSHYFTKYVDAPSVRLGSWVNAHWFWPKR